VANTELVESTSNLEEVPIVNFILLSESIVTSPFDPNTIPLLAVASLFLNITSLLAVVVIKARDLELGPTLNSPATITLVGNPIIIEVEGISKVVSIS
jgi:hypothetical protein